MAVREKDEQLQRYFDGELSADERARVEAELGDEDRERLAALGEMRGLLSGALDAEAAAVELWPAVESGLKRERMRRWRHRMRGPGAVGLVVAMAASLVLFLGRRLPTITNECDIESLEVEGAAATVLRVGDAHHGGDATTTIIWTHEED
jgi:anti-sigma factor RsiW